MRIALCFQPSRLSLAVLLLAAALTTSAGAKSAELPMQTASDPKGRFAIDFPAGWEVRTSEDGSPAVIGTGPGSTSRPNVNVVLDTLPSPMSSEEFAQQSEPALQAIFQDYTAVKEGPMRLAGLPAYYRYYTWRTNSGVSLYQVQVYMAVAKRGFVVTGTTRNDADHLRTELPVIIRIINSFRPSSRR